MSATEANGEVIDGTAVEVSPHQQLVPAPTPALAVTPTVQATELVARLSVIREAADQAMTEGVDYGNVPGTNKPTLFKPGAEKLGVLFQLDIQYVNEKVWGPGEHLTVISHATVFHAPSGTRQGYGEGVCTTRERKYSFRRGERVCPHCTQPAIIKGKAEYGGGWLCFKKKDGCGAKFGDGDPVIEGQQVGDIENPDLPDLWNTVVKMAKKRAQVDAILSVTGASALFTQDMEDAPRDEPPAPPQGPRSDFSAVPEPDPEPELLPDASVAIVLEAIKHAAMGTEWLRSQLIAVGAQDVPEGQIVKGTIQRLTPDQAVEMTKVCEAAAEAKAVKS